MNPTLKAQFTEENIQLAAEIGTEDRSIRDKAQTLFEELGDPLLSALEVGELLGLAEQSEDIEVALNMLCDEGILEKDDKTLRSHDTDNQVLYRRHGVPVQRLRILALESVLSDGTSRFQFTSDGRLIRSIARIDRLDALAGTGQQREQIRNHVERISKGMEEGIQVPNSILLAIDQDHIASEEEEEPPASFVVLRPERPDFVRVTMPGDESRAIQEVRSVEIDFPFRNAAFDGEKSAVLVDGQQRTAALSLVDVDAVPSFSFTVNAVVADVNQAKEIFQIANSTVPISTQFSRALLASMEAAPGYLRQERARAIAVRTLALDDKDSPFSGLVQHPGVKPERRPPVAYNSLFHVVGSFADSSLSIEDNPEALTMAVSRSFELVKKTWPESWGKKPSESRLMHGVGLRATSGLLVSLLERHWNGTMNAPELWAEVEASLKRLRPIVVWSELEAAGATVRARKIFREQIGNRQNTNQDISALTNFLKKESLSLDHKAAK